MQQPTEPLAFSLCKLEVIFADDEEMFHMISIPELVRLGVLEQHIYTATGGKEALDHLAKLQSSPNGADAPLMVVLDTRMPDMDGIECATQVQAMMKQNALNRHPFVVRCTSYSPHEANETPGFHCSATKPFMDDSIAASLKRLSSWWADGNGKPVDFDQHSSSREKNSLPKQTSSNPCKSSTLPVQIIVADDSPINMMATVGLLMSCMPEGLESTITEVETDVDLHNALVESQDGDQAQPLMIILGNVQWTDVLDRIDLKRRWPFLVCNTLDTSGYKDFSRFQARLSWDKSPLDFLAPLISHCRTWWSE